MSKTNRGIEYNFVDSWKGWDIIEEFSLAFYDCELKENLAEKLGTKFASVVNVCANNGVIQVYITGEERDPVEFKFSCKLNAE